MSKLGVITFVLVTLVTAPAVAESLRGGGIACLSEDLFDQTVTAAVKKDDRALDWLSKNGCFVTKAGVPVSVLDRTWTGKAKVRAYVGSQAVVLWTNTENLAR